MNGDGLDYLIGLFLICVVPAIPTLLRKYGGRHDS